VLAIEGLPFLLSSEGPVTARRPEPVARGVRIWAGGQANLYFDPAGEEPVPDAERFVAAVEGDFQLSANVRVQFAGDFDSGVLLAWFDTNNWLKVCAELDPDGTRRVVTMVTSEGRSDDANSWAFEDSVYLRLARVGAAFALHASHDGSKWSMIRYLAYPMSLGTPAKIGFVVQSTQGVGTFADFTDVRFASQTLTTIR
jgi:regulation of enolase protein 1 (concanavalin A-like superfamily)